MSDNTLSYIKNSGVKVKLADGKVHELRYNANSYAYLEDEFGIDIGDIEDINLEEPINIKKLLMAGLIHEYKKEADIPSLFEFGKLVSIMQITIDNNILVYDLNSFEYLCNEFKVPFKKITDVNLKTFKQMLKFLRAGLISEYEENKAPDLFAVGNKFEIQSIGEFEDMLSHAQLNNIGTDIDDIINAAIIKSLPEPDDDIPLTSNDSKKK